MAYINPTPKFALTMKPGIYQSFADLQVEIFDGQAMYLAKGLGFFHFCASASIQRRYPLLEVLLERYYNMEHQVA